MENERKKLCRQSKKCSIFYTIAKMRDTKWIQSKIYFFWLSFLLYAYFCYHFFFRSVVHRGFLKIKLELKHFFVLAFFCFDVPRPATVFYSDFCRNWLYGIVKVLTEIWNSKLSQCFFFVFCRPFRCFLEKNEDRRSSGVDNLDIFLKLGNKDCPKYITKCRLFGNLKDVLLIQGRIFLLRSFF